MKPLPTIIEKPPPLKIGIPSNSRIKEDMTPVADCLELENATDGRLKSRFLPNTFFYPLRVRTIARYIKDAILGLGILGDDTALDEDLDWPFRYLRVSQEPSGEFPPDTWRIQQMELYGRNFSFFRSWKDEKPPEESKVIIEPNEPDALVFYPEKKCFSLNVLPATKLSLLMRDEEIPNGNPFATKIITSYGNTTRKILNRIMGNICAITQEDGQIETLLRAMPRSFSSAVDIVRTGETAKKLRLASVRTLLESRPGVWRMTSYPWMNKTNEPQPRQNQIADAEKILRERLFPLINL